MRKGDILACPWIVRLVSACTVVLGVACHGATPPAPEPRTDPTTVVAGSVPLGSAQNTDQLEEYGTDAARALRLQDDPWLGDFDGMVERRLIRVLVAPSRTSYFLDGVTQRGIAYEGAQLLEAWVNDELETGTLPVHVVLIPVTRDRLLPQLTAGYGDVVSAALTMTPEREARVDFTDPLMRDVRELVVTGTVVPVSQRTRDPGRSDCLRTDIEQLLREPAGTQ